MLQDFKRFDLEGFDEEEDDRLENVQFAKLRGKGAPKKKRTAAGMVHTSLESRLNIDHIHRESSQQKEKVSGKEKSVGAVYITIKIPMAEIGVRIPLCVCDCRPAFLPQSKPPLLSSRALRCVEILSDSSLSLRKESPPEKAKPVSLRSTGDRTCLHSGLRHQIGPDSEDAYSRPSMRDGVMGVIINPVFPQTTTDVVHCRLLES